MKNIEGKFTPETQEVKESLSKKELGHFLKSKRALEGLTRNDILKLTGVSLSNISRLETGKLNDIKITNLIKLASAYAVSAEMILKSFGVEGEVSKKREALILKRKKIEELEALIDEELL